MRERMPAAKVRIIDAFTMEVDKDGRGENILCNVGNVWRLCCDDIDGRVEYVEHYLGLLLQHGVGSGDQVIDLEALVPVIKDRAFLEQLNETEAGKRPYFGEVIAGDIWVVYGVSEENRIWFISEEDGGAQGLSLGEMREKAVANLKRRVPEVEIGGDGPVFAVLADGMYEASVLLLDKVWERLAGTVEGDIVAAVPARYALLFTGSGSEEGLSEIRKEARRIYAEAPYAISETLLVRRGGSWQTWREE